MRDIVMFCFGGRRENMELQLPFIRRILNEHPTVRYHVWNLSRTEADNQYLRALKGERITVRHDFYGDMYPWMRFNDVYQQYAAADYRESLFVKLDDDVVFLESDRFADFINKVDENRDSVVSAKVINNGACTPLELGLWSGFKELGIPLLDVHLSVEYADMCHQFMFDHPELIRQPVATLATEDWLSINVIGYDWPMAVKIAQRIGTQSPTHISGRDFPNNLLGDEGMVNMLPLLVCQGFLACHLNFGPQSALVDEAQVSGWRKRYAEIGAQYLA